VLILGGPRAWRLRVASRCHRDGLLRHGPFVALSGGSDDVRLHRAIQGRLLNRPAPLFHDPLARAEGGTLFLDALERFPVLTQRLLLAFLDRLSMADDARGVWAGRVVAGCSGHPGPGRGVDHVLTPLFDALDKIRFEFSPQLSEELHEIPRHA